jgi:hypothetical protein
MSCRTAHGYEAVKQKDFRFLTIGEIDEMTAGILSGAEKAMMPGHEFSHLARSVRELRQQWENTYSRFQNDASAELARRDLLLRFYEKISHHIPRYLSDNKNGGKAVLSIRAMLFTKPSGKIRISRKEIERQKRKTESGGAEKKIRVPDFEKPVFIISAPRAGSTLLFETLSQFPDMWTIGRESHDTIEGIPGLHPSAKDYASNRLTQSDISPDIASLLRERFALQLEDREGRAFFDIPACHQPEKVRFAEKTPKNALRIPFLRAVFPEALFIILYREAKENISSLMQGWRSRRFVAYRDIPGWPYKEWSFLLVRGWQSMKDRPLAEIAAFQWERANSCILEDLKNLPASSWYPVCYADLIREQKKTVEGIAEFAGLQWDRHIEEIISRPLPVSRLSLSAPAPDKWRKNEEAVTAVLPSVRSVESSLKKLNSYRIGGFDPLAYN